MWPMSYVCSSRSPGKFKEFVPVSDVHIFFQYLIVTVYSETVLITIFTTSAIIQSFAFFP